MFFFNVIKFHIHSILHMFMAMYFAGARMYARALQSRLKLHTLTLPSILSNMLAYMHHLHAMLNKRVNYFALLSCPGYHAEHYAWPIAYNKLYLLYTISRIYIKWGFLSLNICLFLSQSTVFLYFFLSFFLS